MRRTPPRLDGTQQKIDNPQGEEEEEGKEAEQEEEEKGEEEGHHDLAKSSLCPSCRRGFDVALLLPCSHTLCGRCVGGGEGAGRCGEGAGQCVLDEEGDGVSHASCGGTHSAHHRSTSTPVCAVLCPCCRHPVELPCWEWASATCCLPPDPTLTPGWTASSAGDQAEEGMKAFSQRNPFGRDKEDVTDQITASYGSPLEGTIDLREEEMEQSVSGLTFTLDPSAAAPSLHLSTSSLIVTFHGPSPPPLPSRHHGNRVTGSVTSTESQESAPHPLPQVCGDVVIIRGQFYWEVDVCNSTLYRIGVSSLDDACGWWLERRGLSFSTVYDSRREPLCAVPPQIKTLGLFLNMGGGTLSFHNPLTQEHLATLPTRFSHAGVRPALGLGQGRLRLRCGLPPPPHVFLSRASDYRGPTGAGGGRWRRDMPFRSVRMVIQKFEELAVSDSDSGLVSSFGSSCSTLAEPGPSLSFSLSPGAALHSGKEGKEAGAE
ncbi:uncharacterized protein LOC118373522 [Oncorhynchus keta]|uniref:uncharacterized protein LOC118373522 n=1 Tax=Oncorhynchus keta TaxID=8018 RepID=UPI0015FBDE71|nr:uncharacterized protein LOC118373522 [Oncorhynchus keta]